MRIKQWCCVCDPADVDDALGALETRAAVEAAVADGSQ